MNRKDSVRIGRRVLATSGLKFPNITNVRRDISPHKRESCRQARHFTGLDDQPESSGVGGVNRKDSVRIGPHVMATSGLQFFNITNVRRDISPHKRESCIGKSSSQA